MRLLILALLALAPAATAAHTFVYVHDRSTGGAVHGYRLDSASGTLTPLDGSPFALTDDGGNCGGQCETMDTARVGGQRFLLTGGLSGVTPWLIAKDGTLTELPGKVAGGAGDWLGVTTVKRGGHVFVYADENSGPDVHGFELAKDGTLTELPGSPWPAGLGCDGIDSGKDLVVCMNEDAGSLSVFKVQKDGSLVEAPGSPTSFATGFSFNVQVDKSGRHVYAADTDKDLFGFLADKQTGELSPLDGSPFDCGLPSQGTGMAFGRTPIIVAVDSTVTNPGDPALQLLKRKANGQLKAVGQPQGAETTNIGAQAISDDGRWLLVVSDSSDKLESLRIKGSSGKIDSKSVVDLTLINANAVVIVKQ